LWRISIMVTCTNLTKVCRVVARLRKTNSRSPSSRPLPQPAYSISTPSLSPPLLFTSFEHLPLPLSTFACAPNKARVILLFLTTRAPFPSLQSTFILILMRESYPSTSPDLDINRCARPANILSSSPHRSSPDLLHHRLRVSLPASPSPTASRV
jgi:hypothetical protein